ncbi:YceI family protein [Pelagicoccus albus]|nr:YceI family protein [Pelagicoccus albus]
MIKKCVPISFLALASAFNAFAAPIKIDYQNSEFVVDVGATMHSFEVVLNDYKADLALGEGGALEKAEFSFACTDLESDNAKRDKKMLRWLETESYPQISFSLKEVKDGPEGAVGVGDLTMHGMTRTVEVPFTIEKDGSKVVLKGSSVVDHRNYDLEVITMLLMKVYPELEISFTLVGTTDA